MCLEKTIQKYFFSHGDFAETKDALYNGLFCYKPLTDSAIFRFLPENHDYYDLIISWFGEDFSKVEALDKYGIETKVQKDIVNDDDLILFYLVFQHEVRAHRLVYVVSSISILINALNWELNSFMIKCLKERKVNEKRKIHFEFIDKYLKNILFSLRIVLEGYATFRDFLNYRAFIKFKGYKNYEKKAFDILFSH